LANPTPARIPSACLPVVPTVAAMKTSQALALFALALAAASFAPPAAAASSGAQASGDRTVTQVVRLLQDLLKQSKEDGDTERNLYGKYKCYCDTNEEEKKAEIEKLTEEIAILEAKIEELLASSAQLSKEVAQLDKDKAANVIAREEAKRVRDDEHAAFLALEIDLKDAISKMKQAIEVLSSVQADQTLSVATEHKKYMAGLGGGGGEMGLASLKTTVKKALSAASVLVSKHGQQQQGTGEARRKTIEAFLQAPFTGVYSAQSGEAAGILKDMRDTFKANLATATAADEAAGKAYLKYKEAMEQAWDDMDTQYNQKQGELSSNDGDLTAKRTQLGESKDALEDAQTFLARLLEMCASKKKQYDERVALRAQEEAALSEAIAILNSDEAFAAFGTVQATSSTDAVVPTFVQVQRHWQFRGKDASEKLHKAMANAEEEIRHRSRAQAFLQAQRASDKVDRQGSSLLGRIVGMLQASNPFAIVLQEIDKMIALIEKEGKADQTQFDWCVTERQDTNQRITEAEGEIDGLNTDIGVKKTAIEDPVTGLVVSIQNNEESLKQCVDNQASQTADRKESNAEYQKNIANLVSAQALLERAVAVLRKYYASIESKLEGGAAPTTLLQATKKEPSATEPAPPETWEDTYSGQKAQAHDGDTSAVGMLNFIITNTKTEESDAHTAEAADQHAYEDDMAQLKQTEGTLEGELAELKGTLARERKELLEKERDLEKTQAEKAALEAYLEKIKPGCDYIEKNHDLRMGYRATEKDALIIAKGHLEDSPVYKEAMAVAHNESLHDCLSICAPDETHVDCKACLADVTVPAYCAGHRSTKGCEA